MISACTNYLRNSIKSFLRPQVLEEARAISGLFVGELDQHEKEIVKVQERRASRKLVKSGRSGGKLPIKGEELTSVNYSYYFACLSNVT